MESKRGRTISISGLLLSLIMFSLSPVYGDLDCVRWEDLAEHLSEKSIPLIQLNLCDFPNNMQNIEPARVVSQIIENTYYLWEEYDITTDTDAYMCILMKKKPNPGPLSAQEAQVLLTGSMLWRASIANPENRLKHDLNESYLEQEDEVLIKPEAVIGTDDRTRITNTRTFPWNTHCYLEFEFTSDPSTHIGTGCLVTPNMVLTCAHNIYDHETDSYIKKMTVIPGLRQDYKNGPLTEPYESKDIVEFRIAPDYVNEDSVVYEYGAVFLDESFAGINTYMPVEFSSSLNIGDTVYIAGYPGTVKVGTNQEDTDSYALWDASSPITDIYPEAILYTTDTSNGDSGAPIRNRESSIDPYRIIDIHSRSDEAGTINGGSRLGAHNQALIIEWMQPTLRAIFGDTFPSQAIDTTKWVVVNDATVDDVGIGEPSGSYSLRLNGHPSGGDSVESRFIDLSLYSHATLTYWYQRTGGGESPDDGDDLIVECHGGFSLIELDRWIELDRQFGSGPDMVTFEKRTIDLPVMANFRLRIRSIGSANVDDVYDDWFIDDIRIVTRQREVKLIAPDGAAEERFGYSVSISGDYAIAGAPRDDDNGDLSGSAYIFKHNGGSWIQQTKLTASDGEVYDWFGWSVSISGDYAIVGAPYDDDNGGSSGSVYIFKRSGSSWTQQAKLTASDGATGDVFGRSVSISGDYAVVGAHLDGDNSTDFGSAYIFKRVGTIWSEQAKLTASDGAAEDWFGWSVSISGDYAIVGAVWDDDDGYHSGSAYIFKRSGSIWMQQAKLTAPDGAAEDLFGTAVSISGDYAIVGADGDDEKGINSGTAHIFKRSGSSWTQQAKLTASDSINPSEGFGNSVSISEDYAIIGAPYGYEYVGFLDYVQGYGSAYIFKRSGASWIQQARLRASDGASNDYFGSSVSMSGDYAIVGAPYDDDNGSDSGSVYVYRTAE